MKLSNFILQLFLIFIVIPVAVAQNLNKYSENILIAKRYYENSEYRKAAQSYSRAFASNNNLGRADHRYEAARCWGIAGEIDSAFYQLDRCAKARFSEYLKMSTDSAFEKLHGDIRWPKILEIIAMNKKGLMSTTPYRKKISINLLF